MSNFLKKFKGGILCHKKAIYFLINNKLYYFFLFPLIFNIILYFLFGHLINDLTNEFVKNLFIDISNEENWLLIGLNFILEFSIFTISKFLALYIFSLFGGYFTIVFLSPVYSYLCMKTLNIRTGTTDKFVFVQFLKDILRAIYIATRNILLQLLIVVLLFVISFFPFGTLIFISSI